MYKVQDCRILDKIYESQTSIIYRGLCGPEQLPVVLKMLKGDHPKPDELAKYKQEYQIEAGLKKLNGVVDVYGLEKTGNGLVLILEDFGAVSLTSLMVSNPLILEERLVMAIKITDALGEIHAANVIHKHINPSNILINPNTGTLKIIDFGIATNLDQEAPTLVSPNLLEGTLPYIAPEQTGRIDQSIDYRTDYYCLGVSLYELFTGGRPCESSDPLDLVHFHLARNPVFPGGFPESLSNVINKLMAKNAEHRYQSSIGLKADLELCLGYVRSNRLDETFPTGECDIPEKFIISPHLYGRDAEVILLLEAFERASSGAKEITVVCGDGGIGKTSLVKQLYRPVAIRRGYFLSGKFDQLHRNLLHGLVEPFRELIDQILTESDDALAEWRIRLLEALGPNCKVMIDAIPEIELIVGPQPSVPDLDPLEAQNRFRLVFRSFIRVFCLPAKPLVIFLDDVHWADASSLQLLELMMTDPETKYLFLIVSFRDEEVDVQHPVMMALDSVRKENINTNIVHLNPLVLEHIVELISDTVHRDKARVAQLAELVYQKTAGNPFFLKEFLKSLNQDGLVEYDGEAGGWIWAMEKIRQCVITDNVADLMASKIQKLPSFTRELLTLGACLGNQFSARPLAWAVGNSLKSVVFGLMPAVSEGLVFPIGPSYKWIELEILDDLNSLKIEYKFAHDRIQLAAYSLIPENLRPYTHRKLGRTFIENSPTDQTEGMIFEIVGQLNRALDLISDESEKAELAKMNLMAGMRVKNSSAYDAAFMYFQSGLRVLGEEGWTKYYDTSLNLHREITEAAYLTARFDEMEKFASIVLKEARTLLDKIKVYEIKIQSFIALNNRVSAVEIALPVLALLGEKFPEDPGFLELSVDFLKTKAILFQYNTKELADLREMTDPYKLAVMRIISSVVSAAYTVRPSLFPMMLFRMVRLTVKYGIAPQSVLAFAGYALVLCAKIGAIGLAQNFADLALELIKRHEFKEGYARTIFVVNSFIRIRSEPLRDGLKPLMAAYRIGLDVGDLEYAALAGAFYCTQGFAAGRELVELEKDLDLYSKAIGKLKQQTTEYLTRLYHQSVLNLMGRSENNCLLVGDAYNENELLPLMLELNERSIILATYIHKLMLCYLFHEYESALKHALVVEEFLDGAQGTVLVPLAMLYGSLVRLAVFGSSNEKDKGTILKKVAKNQRLLATWSDTAPMNYLNKYYLVEAERSRILKDYHQAADHFETAIRLAREHEYLNEEGLAFELAANFYVSTGKTITARAYMQEAVYCYSKWGSIAKVRYLEDNYPDLLVDRSFGPMVKSPVRDQQWKMGSGSSLDLSAVLRASQVLSGEIVLSELLRKLMMLVIETAGAEKVFLFLAKEDSLFIEAKAGIEDVLLFDPPRFLAEDCDDLSVAVVNYVARTKETLILNDARSDAIFVKDKYLATIPPSSVACVPLMRSGQLQALIYLENNQTTGAFTPERVEMLRFLSSPAAISIQNAILYKTVEESAARYRSLFENAQEAIFIVQDGLIRFANPRTSAISGYPEQELSSIKLLRFVHPDDRELVLEQNRKTLQDGCSPNVYSFRIIRKDNTILWIQLNSVSISWENRAAILNFLTDITELKRAADLNVRTERLQAIGELASGVAHNFNNLLQVIMAGVELALANLEAGHTANLKDYLEQIRESSIFGSETIRRLQSFARIRSDLVSRENKCFDLSELVRQASEISRPWWKTNLEKDGIYIKTETSLANGCFVSGKENEIFEVLINLIKNAVEAMPQGGLIRIKTSVIDDWVVFEIHDTGTGISDENMKRIFDPFWSTKGDMGTGMGLSVTHGIVNSHGGHISVESALGNGTLFKIKLPLAKPTLKLYSTAISSPVESQLRILVVDDIAPLRTLLRDLLTSHGHMVLVAESGMQAVELFGANEFDLVICDLGMPEMSGWEVGELLKNICSERQIPKIPFLLLTGWGGQSLGTDMIKPSGVDGILEKPVDIRRLFEMIRKVVYEHQTLFESQV